MKKNDFIFMMMRSALWQTPIDHFNMTPWEYKEVITYAEKQCVLGLVTDCMRTNNFGLQKKCVIHMIKIQNSLELENRHINSNMEKLVSLLDENMVDYVVVKGQTLASFYPKPLLRVPGDIDFYVHEKDVERVKQLVQEHWGVDIRPLSVDEHKHFPFRYEGTNFEMHYRLTNFSFPPHQRYFDQLVDTMPRNLVKVGNTEVRILQPTLNIYYTFVHLYHHLRKEGVALRQLCDVAIIIRHYYGQINCTFLEEILEKTGYKKAFAAFGSIMVDKLGLTEDEYPVPITASDRKWGEIILGEILQHGNWGKYERETREKKWSIGHSIGTARLLVSRYFRYFSLTPKENLAFLCITVPQLFYASVKKLSCKYWRQHFGAK